MSLINILLIVLPFIGAAILIWIIVLAFGAIPQPSETCFFKALCDLEFLLRSIGTIITIWVLTYTLKKASDTACVQALADIRSKLNSVEKKKIHFFLMDDADEKMAILEDLEKNPKYRSNNDLPRQTEEKAVVRIEMSNVELFDYLGTIELGAIMLSKGLISLEEFDNQFGYRIVNIMRHPDLRGHILDPKCNYGFLLEAICALKRHCLLKLD